MKILWPVSFSYATIIYMTTYNPLKFEWRIFYSFNIPLLEPNIFTIQLHIYNV